MPVNDQTPAPPPKIPLPQIITSVGAQRSLGDVLSPARIPLPASAVVEEAPGYGGQPAHRGHLPPIEEGASHSEQPKQEIAELPGSRPHRRGASNGSDEDEPVMKATSYPGDEWIPEWYPE